MSYASISIDRRADYYARCAALIAADPLDFYTRAERGRRFQASRLKFPQAQSGQAMAVGSAPAAAVAWLNPAKPTCLVQGDAATAPLGGTLAA